MQGDTPSREEVLSSLPQPFRSARLSMYAAEPQRGEDGQMHALEGNTGLSPSAGIWIYELCRRTSPLATLEIGLAYGFSTIYFLAGLAEDGNARHTAIDPYQLRAPGWRGIGLAQGKRFGGDRFRFIEERSSAALIHLAQQSECFQIILVDGRHLFDLALVDFTLSAEVCSMGGYIILDDMWLPSIQRVVSFIRTNRQDFTELETPVANIAAFRRTGTDDRKFKHYADF